MKAKPARSVVKKQKTGKPIAGPRMKKGPGQGTLREVFGLQRPREVQEAQVEKKYYLIYKPYGMMSQFSKENERETLANLNYTFPKDVYPVGRLDADSEGLLLLTNDKSLNDALLNPRHAHTKTYLAQLEGIITEEAITVLSNGPVITVDGKPYKTLPSKVKVLKEEPSIPPRNPPVRYRAAIPTSWIEITVTEGKNRQVRKMCAQAGFPVLRLVRIKIGKLKLGILKPGEIRELFSQEISGLFQIN